MTASQNILMVLTSHATMGASGVPTGAWFEEMATPYYAFLDRGAAVTIASIRGGRVPFDPASMRPRGDNPASVERFLDDAKATADLEASLPVGEAEPDAYDVLLLPGGHGTMWDFPDDQALRRLIEEMWRRGRVIAAVCHGPAGLVNARNELGRPIVEGRRVSAFTDSEERAAGLAHVVPFLLETRLRALGARFEGGPDFQPYAVRDGRLITGQNPMSAEPLAALVLDAVQAPAL